MTGATTLFSSGESNSVSGLLPFDAGFKFIYVGNSYDSLMIAANGFVKLGATVAPIVSNFLTASTHQPVIAPFWDVTNTGSDGHVKYKTFGSAPYRKFVVEWFVRVSGSSSLPANGMYQLWLHEETGRIDFVYDLIPVTANTYSCGISENLLGYAAVTVDAVLTSSTVSYSSTNDANNVDIDDGTQFSFIPDSIVPALPINYGFTYVGDKCLDYSWDDNSTNELFFRVMKSMDGVNYTLFSEITSSTEVTTGTTYSFRDSVLNPGTAYYYTVLAANYGTVPDSINSDTTTSPASLSGVKTIPGDYSSITEALTEIRDCQALSGHIYVISGK